MNRKELTGFILEKLKEMEVWDYVSNSKAFPSTLNDEINTLIPQIPNGELLDTLVFISDNEVKIVFYTDEKYEMEPIFIERKSLN